MAESVGLGQMFELETGRAVLFGWPVDPVRAQGIAGPNQIDNVPAGIALLPFSGIGIDKVTVKTITADLIIKSQRVVAGDAGIGLAEQGIDPPHKLGFRQPFAIR